ncbi:MAG: glycogen debranching protein GlgX [Candidatus Omnitrophica bacterium]|nr:glycogen debranching protein GlgX [Candidatus Omnitrophota bacterium]
MIQQLIVQTNRELSAGNKDILGATITAEGVNFAVYSQFAAEVFLLLFDKPVGSPTDIIKIENKTDNVWHVHVKGLKAGQLYGYKVNGDYNPGEGKRFNPHKLLIDPYAKALTGKFKNQDNLIFAYDLNSPEKDLTLDERDNSDLIPKSIVVDDAFDWQDDKPPAVLLNNLIVYETHIKGFTAHVSSGVKDPGTYLGFIEKIPYLKELGINAVELMPVHQFFIRSELIDKGLTDYWGYNTIGFFAPEISYSTQKQTGCQVEEFKTLVRELHKAGIEVIMDVVYNHTGEGNQLGPTLCFKGIDNPTYYSLIQNPDDPKQPHRYYLNDTGCGNTFNIEHPVVMRLVLDSLRYWAETMHVDGFRFDLASILARVKGEFNKNSKFFEAISQDPVLSKIKMIAEPWDLTTYQVGKFPKGWSEWNGKFRDTARQFLKGDERQAAEMAKRLTGSADLYQEDGKNPYNSINFITCHDGLTLHDLYSYNSKYNEDNLEDNKDGADDNYSWNCGVEGETSEQNIIQFRKQMMKNALCALLLSSGIPMLLYGDEVARTQRGNNNVYCQDNELTWFDWGALQKNAEILNFCKKIISFRKTYPILRYKRFFTGQDENSDTIPDILWFGKHRDDPNWASPKLKTLCYLLAGNEAPSAQGDYYLFFVFNIHNRGVVVDLPLYEGLKWYSLIDTSRKSGEDFRSNKKEKLVRNQDKQHCSAYSVNVFLGEK